MSGFTIHHPRKLLLFSGLSLADLFLTWKLLNAGAGTVYECNPIAAAWLDSYGSAGLAIFKSLAMTLVAITSLYISFYRPPLGGRILGFACLATALVVGYSCVLTGFLHAETAPEMDMGEELTEKRTLLLDQVLAKEQNYCRLVNVLGKDLIADRCSLIEATERLAKIRKNQGQPLVENASFELPGMFGSGMPGQSFGLPCFGPAQPGDQTVAVPRLSSGKRIPIPLWPIGSFW